MANRETISAVEETQLCRSNCRQKEHSSNEQQKKPGRQK
jgi:hypothetical protein